MKAKNFMTSKRENKGMDILAKGYIKPCSNTTFKVTSDTDKKKQYDVEWKGKKWFCNCEDFKSQNKKCKHIYAVSTYLSLQDIQVGVRKISDSDPCPFCGRTEYVIKDGLSESRKGLSQRFYCKKCETGFSQQTGFNGSHGQAFVIILSLDLYYRGLSLRQISEHFESVYMIKVSHGTIYGWIKHYVKMVSKYLEKKKINSGDKWHADETVVRVNGKHCLIWSLLDSETRILLAAKVNKSRGAEQAYNLIEKGLSKVNNIPSEIVTDCLGSYTKAINKKFGEELKHPIIHIQTGISSPLSNNKIERFQRTVKQRFKAMGTCFQSEETARIFKEGFNIYYNNVRKHSSLDGKTPMEASGNCIGNNWVKLVKKASKNSSEPD